jgi:hypothetical protein
MRPHPALLPRARSANSVEAHTCAWAMGFADVRSSWGVSGVKLGWGMGPITVTHGRAAKSLACKAAAFRVLLQMVIFKWLPGDYGT